MSSKKKFSTTFSTLLNVSTLDEARTLPSMALIAANVQQISTAPYGTYPYGPTLDHSFVPGLPNELLLQRACANDVKIMVGHNSDEGLYFVDPRITDDAGFRAYISGYFPSIKASVLNYIVKELYPPMYDGSQRYRTFLERVSLFASEALLTCNPNFIAHAYGNKTYNFRFSIPPAIHGEDLAYTFYNGSSAEVSSLKIAEALQSYIVSFAKTGRPSTSVPDFLLYGKEATVLDLNVSAISTMPDSTANARCTWWQKSLYY